MLYIIGGASRAGKSIAAKKLFQSMHIPYLSIDPLVMGFTNGMPQIGIHAEQPGEQIAANIWPFLRAICVCMIENGENYVIEGEAMLPSQVKELIDEYPDDVKACFIGYASLSPEQKLREVRQHKQGQGDWSVTESDEYVLAHLERMVKYSKYLGYECERLNIRYFDSGRDFTRTSEEVVAYMKGAEKEKGSELILEQQLIAFLAEQPSIMEDLRRVRDLMLPECYIGAGYIRSCVWDKLHGYEYRGRHDDIDVVYFDPEHLDEQRDVQLERQLIQQTGNPKWSVKNQARMHLRNGVPPYQSTWDALSKWPETVTAVGAKLDDDNCIQVCAPYGLEDLFRMTVRQSPMFEDKKKFLSRIEQKQWRKLWPKITIVTDSYLLSP